MGSSHPQSSTTAPGAEDRVTLREALDGGRAGLLELPDATRALAVQAESDARRLGDRAALARALALQGMLLLNAGGQREAFAVAAEAEAEAQAMGDPTAAAEVAALGAHLSFFSGSYREALRQADRAVAESDRADDLALRIHARRCACLVFGNLDVPGWPARLQELLGLAVAAGDRWHEALSRNDLAHWHMTQGAVDAALAEIGRAWTIATALAPRNDFAFGVLACTRGEIHSAAGRHVEALADARTSMHRLTALGRPNPYVYGMSVHVAVQALLACGAPEQAWRDGRAAVARLGEVVPAARSMILRDVAEALRQAGRLEDAYSALAESAELERLSFRELTALQRDFEAAIRAQRTARAEADALAARNRELEAEQGVLRDQAERDPLTGLFNRRYLDAALARLRDDRTGPLSIAVVDVDHFKAVNDRFGHAAGDRVLARAAALLRETVRGSDVVVRTGGEEFVVLMPGAAPGAARACAERVRRAIAAHGWEQIAPGLPITASVGVVSAPDSADVDGLLRLADERLYAAKRAGRNRVDAHTAAAAA